MTDSFNFDAYLNRIQYRGNFSPTLDALSDLLLAHTRNIPFENLDVLLGRPIKLDIDSVQDKLVHHKRGGYCFEHGTLFAAALERIGFQFERHTARATLFVPRSEAPRTHMFLTVFLPEGRFAVDPGFGALAARFPVPVPDGDESELQGDVPSHRLVQDGIYKVLRVQTDGKTTDVWSSNFEPDNLVDFVLGSHYTSTHPNSPFVQRIILRSFSGDKIVSAVNRDVKIRSNGETQSFQLADRSELRALLVDHFGFDLPEIEHVRVPGIPEWL